MRRLVSLVAGCAVLAACSSTAVKPTPQLPAAHTAAKPSATVIKPTTAPAESDARKFERIVKVLASKSIFFDYNAYAIKPEYQVLLKQDYDFLKSAPGGVIVLEGNADERGSTEYNLALGQKRADAVKLDLKLLGVQEAQVESLSYGKEKPRATCHEEKCWAENRRVDINYKKP